MNRNARFAVLSVVVALLFGCGGGGSGGAGEENPTPAVAERFAHSRWDNPSVSNEHIELFDPSIAGVIQGRIISSPAMVFELNPDETYDGRFGGALWFYDNDSQMWDLGSVQGAIEDGALTADFAIPGSGPYRASFSIDSTWTPVTSALLEGTWGDGFNQITFAEDGAVVGSNALGCLFSGGRW